MNTQTWLPIKGATNSYMISSEGLVKSLKRTVPGKNGQPLPVKERILKGYITSVGYEQISLSGKKYMVHRIVAQTFIPNPYNKPEVNHIDGNKLNNEVSNLEWNTRSENQNHAKKHGLLAIGTRQPGSKLKDEDIQNIFRLRIEGLSYEAIARKYIVDFTLIEKVLKRKLWKHVPVIFSLLLLMIPLSVRSQVSNDTIRCYGVTELRKIALALTKGQHCDSLLTICDSVSDNLDQIIILKDRQVAGLKSESSLKESIISRKEQEKQTIQLNLDKANRKLAWTKIGWGSTVAVALTYLGYSLFHR